MAHSCPTCDQYCTCGGDIDDMQLDGTIYQANCYHCDCDDEIDGEDLDDDFEQEIGECELCEKTAPLVQAEIAGDHGGCTQNICYKCCEEWGYCFSCGTYSSGHEIFDFSDVGPYCENCQDQIRDALDDNGDDLEEWEYPHCPPNTKL